MEKIKQAIRNWLEVSKKEAKINDHHIPKLFADDIKSVSYEIDGLTKSHCQVTEYPSGEGYTISFETNEGSKNDSNWVSKRIDLHHDEIDVLLSCLNHLKHFDV